jgi:hypothetical protein
MDIRNQEKKILDKIDFVLEYGNFRQKRQSLSYGSDEGRPKDAREGDAAHKPRLIRGVTM